MNQIFDIDITHVRVNQTTLRVNAPDIQTARMRAAKVAATCEHVTWLEIKNELKTTPAKQKLTPWTATKM